MLRSATSCANAVGALIMTPAIIISVFTISLMRSPHNSLYHRGSEPLNRDSRYYDAARPPVAILPRRTSDRGCAVISLARSRFEEIRRETTRGARSRMQMRDVLAHKGEIDISFSAGQDSEPEVVPAGSGDVRAARRITIWLAMTAARFAFRPTKGDAAVH